MMSPVDSTTASMKSSLQEVASLLIVLYNRYLRNEEGKGILKGLLSLVHDLNLTEVLCILDVERIRLKVMRCNGDERAMSYESFYEWLRDISAVVFEKYGESGCRALNILLSKHVIPFATKEKDANLAVLALSARGLVELDDATLRVFMPYATFLRLWHASSTFSESSRLSPLHCFALRSGYQPQTTPSLRTSNLNKIFEVLKSCGIFSGDVLEDDHAFFAEMAQIVSSPRDAMGSGDALNCLAFPGFLNVLERAAKKVTLTQAKSMGMGLSPSVKLIILMQKLSENLLHTTLQKFANHELGLKAIEEHKKIQKNNSEVFSAEKEKSNHSYSQTYSRAVAGVTGPLTLGLSSVLWFARQSGITQLPGLSLTRLLDELVSNADVTQQQGGFKPGGFKAASTVSSSSLRALTWGIDRLPRVLCQICESHCLDRSEAMAGGLAGVSSMGRVALLLAQYVPAACFACPIRSPALLAPLYEPHSLQQLLSLEQDINSFFKAITVLHCTMDTSYEPAESSGMVVASQCSKVEVATIRQFNKLCSSSGVVPHLLSPALMQETCEHLLGFAVKEDSLDVQVCQNDWVEILYVLAQLCFKEPHTEEEGEGQEVRKLFDLLKCFTSVSYLSDAIGRSRLGADPQSFLKESLRAKAAAAASLSSVVAVKSVFAGHIAEDLEESIDAIESVEKSHSLSRRLEQRLRRKSDSSEKCDSAFPPEAEGRRDEDGRGGSGFSLRQIVIALAHYPINSVDLNPWTLYRILVCSEDREREEDGDGWDDTLYRMAAVFKLFCRQFQVSSSDLTAYLASFYKEDYYVADTSQMLALRDEEGKYGIPNSQFHFDGNAYSKKVKVMKPAVEGVMASAVFDLLFTERIAILLHSHSSLLRWEYSRACARHRGLDPFTRDLSAPLPTARVMAAYPHDCRMSIAGAVKWAETAAGISEAEAMLQLKRTALLSGGGAVGAGYHLTFSVFVIYAVHCFSSQALLTAPMQSHTLPDVFEACIQELLERSAAVLTTVRNSLQLDIDILDLMFKPTKAPVTRMTTSERLILVRHSLIQFDAVTKDDPYDDCLPPRPAPHLWDATRFLEYCCYYGLVERVGSISLPLKVFMAHLTAVSSFSAAPSVDCVLAVLPIRASSAMVLSLLEETATELCFSTGRAKVDLVLELLPAMISLLDLPAIETNGPNLTGHSTLRHSPRTAFPPYYSSCISFDDVLRYGGDRSMRAFSQHRGQLMEVYGALRQASSHVLRNSLPPSQGIFRLPVCGQHTQESMKELEEEDGCREALLSVVCSYLSCCGLVPAGKIAKIAKQSLHTRLRPILTSAARRQPPSRSANALYAAAHGSSGESKSARSGSNESHDLVTVSMAEFEEMFLRCAFSCWESSGALTSASSGSSSSPDPEVLFEACSRPSGGLGSWSDREGDTVEEVVCMYCIEGTYGPSKDRDWGDLSCWGSDFVGPYARTLFAMSAVPHPHSLAVIDLEAIAAADAAAAAERDREEARLKRLEEAALHAERKRQLAEERRIAAECDIARRYLDANMAARGAVSALIAEEQPVLPNDMKELMDKSRYLSQASVGINVMLGGSKEELWPVYATYCSCGDSTDPGTLSGPNLFALLSRLGILNNRIALSDVGMLLHQICAHMCAQNPVSVGSVPPSEAMECLSLSFEQFLVFLCAYSQLFFEGTVSASVSASPCASDTASISPSMGGDTESTLSTLSPDPHSLRREAIRLMANTTKQSPSGNAKPTRHRAGSAACSTASDIDSIASPYSVKDISVTESHFAINDRSKGLNQKSPGPTGLNIIIGSDADCAGGSASASRAWFSQWRGHMNSSTAFKDLLEDYMLPVLRSNTLLACPEDARLRDRYCVLFSLEVLLALQRVEETLRAVFLREERAGPEASTSRSGDSPMGRGRLGGHPAPSSGAVVAALKRINLVPQVITEAHLAQLIGDVMAEGSRIHSPHSNPFEGARDIHSRESGDRTDIDSSGRGSPKNGDRDIDSSSSRDRDRGSHRDQDSARSKLLFAHWAWVVCLVAFEAMDSAVRLSSTPTKPESIPSLVAELVDKIVTAIDRSSSAPTPIKTPYCSPVPPSKARYR